MPDLAIYLEQAARDIGQTLEQELPLRQTAPESQLYFAMRYSLFAGGKRLRPALFLATLEAFGYQRALFLPFAASLEMIHTYSLIHDDLPAMDNDDLRRGQPTCHRTYGEATAILAGDGLLTHAFSLMARPIAGIEATQQLAALQEVALYAGIGGMVAGQAAEIAAQAEAVPMDVDLLCYISRGKTGALFKAAVVSAAQLAGAEEGELAALRVFAEKAGLVFQIIDDVLDVEGSESELGKRVGSDAARALTTYATLRGTAAAYADAAQLAKEAVTALAGFGSRADLLRAFPAFFLKRSK